MHRHVLRSCSRCVGAASGHVTSDHHGMTGDSAEGHGAVGTLKGAFGGPAAASEPGVLRTTLHAPLGTFSSPGVRTGAALQLTC